MVKKYGFGKEIETDAVSEKIEESSKSELEIEATTDAEGTHFTMELTDETAVYGLGEQMRGINKRGWIYTSRNMDDPSLTESRESLYGSHNFILITTKERNSGIFIDATGRVTYDIGYTKYDELRITVSGGFDLYTIEERTALEVVREFRRIIGKSYVPPKWALGYGQSRWGYKTEADVREIVSGFEKNKLPLSMIYLDIDYMDRYKDFTIDKNRFPDFEGLVRELKAKGIRLIPIIDAAIKIEEGYEVYDEGVKNNRFCKDKEGKEFVVGVWPGDSVLPDVLNKETREWFGEKYKILLDKGIEGFWNDMNEPSLFYSKQNFVKCINEIAEKKGKDLQAEDFNHINYLLSQLANNEEDFKSFYHNADGKTISHDKVHNVYGYLLTRAAAEYFEKYNPNKKYLLFSRSSSIGMHRYGGIWMGDNASWWVHMLSEFKMLPSLNMCGFLYVGADVGGFDGNTTEDLLLRWFALNIFIPLMRNHSVPQSRRQEPYMFGKTEVFRNFLNIRYKLIPYIYEELERCAESNEMLFKPLAFEYPDDERAKETEDQLIFGKEVMLSPVFEQNASGRYVYLPEKMKLIKMKSCEEFTVTELEQGDHYIKVPLDTFAFFVKENGYSKIMDYIQK